MPKQGRNRKSNNAKWNGQSSNRGRNKIRQRSPTGKNLPKFAVNGNFGNKFEDFFEDSKNYSKPETNDESNQSNDESPIVETKESVKIPASKVSKLGLTSKHIQTATATAADNTTDVNNNADANTNADTNADDDDEDTFTVVPREALPPKKLNWKEKRDLREKTRKRERKALRREFDKYQKAQKRKLKLKSEIGGLMDFSEASLDSLFDSESQSNADKNTKGGATKGGATKAKSDILDFRQWRRLQKTNGVAIDIGSDDDDRRKKRKKLKPSKREQKILTMQPWRVGMTFEHCKQWHLRNNCFFQMRFNKCKKSHICYRCDANSEHSASLCPNPTDGSESKSPKKEASANHSLNDNKNVDNDGDIDAMNNDSTVANEDECKSDSVDAILTKMDGWKSKKDNKNRWR